MILRGLSFEKVIVWLEGLTRENSVWIAEMITSKHLDTSGVGFSDHVYASLKLEIVRMQSCPVNIHHGPKNGTMCFCFLMALRLSTSSLYT